MNGLYEKFLELQKKKEKMNCFVDFDLILNNNILLTPKKANYSAKVPLPVREQNLLTKKKTSSKLLKLTRKLDFDFFGIVPGKIFFW